VIYVILIVLIAIFIAALIAVRRRRPS